MSTPSMNSPRSAKNLQEDEPRDTGTFKATLPALGGFLTSDGQPIDTAPHDMPVAHTTLPYYCDDEDPAPRLWLTVTWTLVMVTIVAVALVSLLLFVLCDNVIGQADGLLSVLRTSVH